ncbi:MAG: hypothetical protein EWV58_13995 [Microcystis aeruginosa Ma_MB_F_20061100_S19]|nr:MAG: hypothetical protein EWV59_19730 [Microcystis aeruginosa Ma_MB_F_20061100_S19D]TRU13636.1 MAG: hypothetical protein EWV58_13995 [Microcystis aeruginosa Ma_MB_F_20061100_S19]
MLKIKYDLTGHRLGVSRLPKRKTSYLTIKITAKYLSKINYTYLTTSCLLPFAFCLLPIFPRKFILHDYLYVSSCCLFCRY